MAAQRILDHLTRTRAAAGTALVLGLVAIPVIPHARQSEASRSPAGVRNAERETQLARIARWREIRREARARSQPTPGATPQEADSLQPAGAAHPGGV
jgi:hypothetical protein